MSDPGELNLNRREVTVELEPVRRRGGATSVRAQPDRLGRL